MKYQFKELVDLRKLQELTDELYIATSIPSAIISMDGEILTGSGWQRICTQYHRRHPETEKACIASDIRIRKGLDEGEPFVIYQCPQGLVDASSPVVIEGQHMANVFAGQLFMEPPGPEVERRFREQARAHGFDEEDYIEAFRAVPVFPLARFRHALAFLASLANMIAEMGLVRMRELEAAEALSRTNQRLDATLNALPDLMFEVDETGRIHGYRAPKAALLYRPPEAFLGRTIQEVLPSDSADIIMQAIRQAVSEGSAFGHAYPLPMPDGLKWFELSIAVQGASADGGTRLVVLARDITERRRMDEALREALRFNEQIINSAQDGVIVYGSDLHYRVWSPFMEQISGRTAAEVIGRHPFDCFPFLRETGLLERLQNALAGQPQPPLDFPYHLPESGRSGWTSDISGPLRNAEGKVIGVIGMVREISDRINAEQSVRRSLKEKEVLLREIHHRVKNNLQVISSLLDLQSGSLADEAVRRVFLESRNRVKVMAMVHETLYRSQDLSVIPLASYLRELVEYLSHLYGGSDRAVHLECRIEPGDLCIDDAIACGLIVNELISNAYKYAFRGGVPEAPPPEVRLGVRFLAGGEVELSVADNGTGLPAGLEVARTPTMGLQLVDLLVRQLRGALEVDREQGTAFRVRFRPSGEEKEGQA